MHTGTLKMNSPSKTGPLSMTISVHFLERHFVPMGNRKILHDVHLSLNFLVNCLKMSHLFRSWRNFPVTVGAENVIADDFISVGSAANNSFTWGIGCGPGSYTSCGGIGNSQSFNQDPKVHHKFHCVKVNS